MSSSAAISAILAAFAFATQFGCSTIAKQAFFEARGATAEILPIAGSAYAGDWNGRPMRFASARTDIGGNIVPGTVLAAWDAAAKDLERTMTDSGAKGANLEASANVLFFQRKGLLGSAMLLTRVQVTDAGRQTLDAVVRTESKSFRAGDEADLCEESVEAVAEYVTGYEKKLLGGKRSDDEADGTIEQKQTDGK